MDVACLPAPPDHRADLGVEGKAVTIPFQAKHDAVWATLGFHRGGESSTEKSSRAGEEQEAGRAGWGPSIHIQVSL